MVVDRDTEGTVKKVENVKVAVFSCELDASSTETTGMRASMPASVCRRGTDFEFGLVFVECIIMTMCVPD
jgi:hypothetical protein